MLDDNESSESSTSTSTRRRAAGRPAGPPAALDTDIFAPPAETKAAPPAKKAPATSDKGDADAGEPPAKKAAAKKAPAKKAAAKKAPAKKAREAGREGRAGHVRQDRRRPQGQRHVPAARDHHVARAPQAGDVGRPA